MLRYDPLSVDEDFSSERSNAIIVLESDEYVIQSEHNLQQGFLVVVENFHVEHQQLKITVNHLKELSDDVHRCARALKRLS